MLLRLPNVNKLVEPRQEYKLQVPVQFRVFSTTIDLELIFVSVYGARRDEAASRQGVMSETLHSDPSADSALPPFSTFGDMENEQRILTADTRLLDPAWEYYERTGDTVSVIASQPQYRPWESMPITVHSKDSFLRAGFSAALDYQPVTLQPITNKLPSFQSQFQTFPETSVIPETGLPSVTPVPVTASPTPSASPSQLTQLTQLTTPSSPAHLTTLAQMTPLSTTLTTLSPVNATTFHTLTAVNARSFPIVPAPLQARELAPAGQTYIDDRHIQLYQPNIATINAYPTQNGILHQNGTLLHQNGSLIQNIQSPTVVHVLKNEPFDVKTLQEKYTPNGLHHSNFQNPMMIDNGYEKKTNGFGTGSSPTRSDFRKKERRKMRANSTESDGSNMEVGSESSGQVAAVSSTAGFKSPMHGAPPMATGPMEMDDITSEKQVRAFNFFFFYNIFVLKVIRICKDTPLYVLTIIDTFDFAKVIELQSSNN